MHPGGLARTERLHSAATKMTCHTLKCVESVPTSSLFTRLAEHMLSEEERKGITDGNVHKIPSSSPRAQASWKVARTGRPRFHFFALINVALSSKSDCNQ